jgi:hypothetical protein
MTPFRSEKDTNWEGAFRVPLLVRWTGKIPAGVVSNEIVQHHDWLPTFLAMAGEPDVTEKLLKGHKAAGKTFTASVGNAPGKVFTLVSQKDFAVQLIQSLGLKLSPAVVDASKNEAGSPTGTLTPEQFDKVAADAVIIAFTSPDLRQAFESNQLVAPVKAGNYLVTDMETISALRYPTVYDIPFVLDKLKPVLAKLS